MHAAENEFVNPNSVKSVVVNYHSVQKRTIKHWFSSEEITEEVKTNSTKVVFDNGLPIKKENIKFGKDGTYRTRVTFQNGLPVISETISGQ